MQTSNKLGAAFKKAVSSANSRPALQCLHFSEDGSVIATDSHVLLRIEDFHHLKQDFNLNLKTFGECDENYPDTSRIIPKSYQYQFHAKTSDLIDVLPIIKGMAKLKSANDPAVLKWENDNETLTIAGGENNLVTVHIPIVVQNRSSDPLEVSFNAEYMAQAIEFFTQALPTDEVIFNFNASLTPFSLTAQKATYLITPIRRF